MDIREFRIAVPDADLDDLRQRLRRTRWPDQYEGGGWDLGTDKAWLSDLIAYWLDGFDWRTCEGELNSLPQFVARIDGQDIHFVHSRSVVPDALPIVITHGWPGSFVEMAKLVPQLVDPERHGADPHDAFHVVVPSLPGYGFSSKPAEPGMNHEAIAGLWAKLMEGLGYRRFAVQGGDHGSAVSVWLARRHADRVAGFHLNMITPGLQPATQSLAERPLSEAEQKMIANMKRFREQEGAYAQFHRTKPQTLGYALNDSAAGLAGYIAEKFRAWSDCGGRLESAISRDELLANICVYWFTGTITSSMRLYREGFRAPFRFEDGERLRPPFGYAEFPGEIIRPPREWAERFFRVQRWTAMPRGGHFAALEQPQLLAADLREFFRPLR
jgi:pimeloyl-ACP methyl ester carboxylesterase